MKATYGVEYIGANLDADCRAAVALADVVGAVDLLGIRGIDRVYRPWLAEITGLDERYGLARTFLPGRTDYTDSNSVGSRGIRVWWLLESGRLYECHCWYAWSGAERRYLQVSDEGVVVEVDRAYVEDMLRGTTK